MRNTETIMNAFVVVTEQGDLSFSQGAGLIRYGRVYSRNIEYCLVFESHMFTDLFEFASQTKVEEKMARGGPAAGRQQPSAIARVVLD